IYATTLTAGETGSFRIKVTEIGGDNVAKAPEDPKKPNEPAPPVIPEPPPVKPDAGITGIEIEKTQVVELGSTIQELAVAAGGGRILFHLADEQKLAVLDVKQAKVVGHIPVKDGQVHFAAGMNDAVVILENARSIERWDLTTLKRVSSKPLPPGPVKTLIMGAASAGPALLVNGRGTQALDTLTYNWIDLTTLTVTPIKREGHLGPLSWRDNVHIRASADGRVFGMWQTHVSPTGVNALVIGTPTSKAYNSHESAGAVVPSATGKFLATWGGLY